MLITTESKVKIVECSRCGGVQIVRTEETAVNGDVNRNLSANKLPTRLMSLKLRNSSFLYKKQVKKMLKDESERWKIF